MNQQQIQIFTSADGQARLEVALDQDTVWLNLDQMVSLFDWASLLFLDIYVMSLQRANLSASQLLQKMQQLRPTAKLTRSITLTWM